MAKGMNWYDEKLTPEDRKIEKWKDIPAFEGLYRISSLGRIMSDYKAGYKNITPQVSNYGQLQAQLTTPNAKRKDDLKLILVGKTVAELFVPNPHGYSYIRFKNGNALDCRASNIEWTKLTDKMKEQYGAMGKRVNKYDLNGEYIETYEAIKDISQGTNLNSSGISQACKTLRPYAGFQWRFDSECPRGNSIGKYIPPKKQTVLQIDKKTQEIVRVYEDINEVMEKFVPEKGKPDRGNIMNACKGKRPSAYGYKWAYSEK